MNSPSTTAQATRAMTNAEFAIFCLGGYLLSVSYGSTFLLSDIVLERGGTEADAGTIISAAMVSTMLLVVFSGHLGDLLGSARAVAAAAVLLVGADLGFAFMPGHGGGMIAVGLILGAGWGVFYTLGPMIVASVTTPATRTRSFALLSGSMMSGIGSGPLIGRGVLYLGLPLNLTFLLAAAASLLGAGAFLALSKRIEEIRTAMDAGAASRISAKSARGVLSSKAVFPILMVGVGGAIFGGFSSFQTSYAQSRDVDFSVFFAGFMLAAIGGRMFLSGPVTRKEPHGMAAILTGLVVGSMLLFKYVVVTSLSYFLAAAVLGVGYGLTYSVINGLAANEAPPSMIAQSLLLFSLSYFVGLFGYPIVAGRLIVDQGVDGLLNATLGLSCLNLMIALIRFATKPRTLGRQ